MSAWDEILDSLQAPAGYCALRQNRDSKAWWLDPSTFGLSAAECRERLEHQDYRSESSREFAAKNPALVLALVDLSPTLQTKQGGTK